MVYKPFSRTGGPAKSFVPRTTDSKHGRGYWPNLLLGQPLPKAADMVWVSDITYLPLINGDWAYLATWMDLFSRKVVGWQVGETVEDELVIRPLRRALQLRQPAVGLIIHRSGDPVGSRWAACAVANPYRAS